MPAHSSGAASSQPDAVGDLSDEVVLDDDLRGCSRRRSAPVVLAAVVGLARRPSAVLLLAGPAVSHSPQESTMQPTPTRSPARRTC